MIINLHIVDDRFWSTKKRRRLRCSIASHLKRFWYPVLSAILVDSLWLQRPAHTATGSIEIGLPPTMPWKRRLNETALASRPVDGAADGRLAKSEGCLGLSIVFLIDRVFNQLYLFVLKTNLNWLNYTLY